MTAKIWLFLIKIFFYVTRLSLCAALQLSTINTDFCNHLPNESY